MFDKFAQLKGSILIFVKISYNINVFAKGFLRFYFYSWIGDFMKIKLTLSILFLFSANAFALVDYTENSSEARSNQKPNYSTQKISGESRSSLNWKSEFSLTANYESTEIEANKYGFVNLNTHFQTPFNMYFDLSYWSATSKSGNQNGNPKFLLGLNWFKFGSPSEEAKIDFIAGAKLSGKSELASSRTDKIFGLETTKRFGTFGLGLGYDLTLTGAPKNDTEMDIGNIHRIVVSGGWMVSNDIQFEMEAENFRITQGSSDKALSLAKEVTFSTLSPKLNLSLAPAVKFELGARFQTSKVSTNQDLKLAKLYDVHGAYSNSMFAGLGISL
jgi:hypothetical protein